MVRDGHFVLFVCIEALVSYFHRKETQPDRKSSITATPIMYYKTVPFIISIHFIQIHTSLPGSEWPFAP